ncbi:MAG: hypothetical protein M8364_15795 [Methylobacter sp.]|uniref:hypothetical protein n=1 Tax=Methylobacter sp. TaxID=2051955 RepID=UPI00258F8C3F|nr:hypothetical protein [Methylobacter sp.]MCL7422354.1 hypothetical protein [Methylobacter sp.]
MSIYLNAVIGSRELEGSAIDKAIMTMALRLAKARKTLGNNGGVAVDLTLLLPGKTHKPDFKGMRMTRFSSTEGVLYIESAVPEKMLHSEQAELYVSALLQDAVDNAADYFSDRGLAFSHAQWQSLLQPDDNEP